MSFNFGLRAFSLDCKACAKMAIFFSLSGAILLSVLATVQYLTILHTPPHLKSYLIPIFVGTLGGAALGISYGKRRQYAQSLARREAELTAIFQAAHNVAFINFVFDGTDPVIYNFSAGAVDLFGYTEEQVISKPCYTLCGPDEMQKMSVIFRNMCNSRYGFTGDMMMRHKNGALFPAFFSLQPVVNEMGGLTSALGVAIDLTAQKQIEAALQETEARLKTIFDSVHIGLMVVDAETQTIVDANNMAARMVGIPKDELVASHCRKFFCPSGNQKCPIIDLGTMVDNAERTLVDILGREIPILKTVASVNIGARRYLVESFIDISDRKRAEEALKSSNEFSTTVLNSMNDAVCIIDINDYRLHAVNAVFCAEYALTMDEAVGKRCYEVIHHQKEPCCMEGEESCPIQHTMKTGEYAQGYHEHVCEHGTTKYVEVSASPVFDKAGKVERVVLVSKNVTERKRAEQEIQQLAYYDALTGLPNRQLFRERLAEALADAHRKESKVGLLFLDLDRFKGVNDTLGHSVGDELLKVTAERLQGCLRKSDTVARLGGDEFVIILPSITHGSEITGMAERILSVLSVKVHLNSQELYSTGSIGIAIFPMDGRDVDTLLKNADIAMYQAKEQGRNTYQFFAREMNVKAVERLALEASLRKGLERQEFLLYYQPQYNLLSGNMVGVEALVRWNHPELGLLSPSKFIPLAEETGIIIPLGEWVLSTACRQVMEWQKEGMPQLRLGVNISAHQFKQQDLSFVDRILHETGLNPSSLDLELTETTLMENATTNIKKLERLKSLGIQLSVDDFGTGYCSLNYLKHFPLDRVKIAQSFVRDIGSNQDDSAIAEAIIKMAHSLKLSVIAEGVETSEQLEFLRVRDCDEVQGFFLSKPLPVHDFHAAFELQGKTA